MILKSLGLMVVLPRIVLNAAPVPTSTPVGRFAKSALTVLLARKVKPTAPNARKAHSRTRKVARSASGAGMGRLRIKNGMGAIITIVNSPLLVVMYTICSL